MRRWPSESNPTTRALLEELAVSLWTAAHQARRDAMRHRLVAAIEAILEFPPPTNVYLRQLRGALALAAILMVELDAIKKKRIAGLMLRRDWGQHTPWPTWPKEDETDLTHMSRKVKEVIRAAGLRDELTFTSFRHGGSTEAGDAELTDRELMAQGRHKSPKVLGKYVKKTMRQVASGIRKRHARRTNRDDLSE
jgi:hypothetical protein